MKKYILSVLFLFAVLITPMAQVQAAGLTPVQVSAIVSLLQSLGVDQSVIDSIQTSLSGTTIVTPPPPVASAPAHKLSPTGVTVWGTATSRETTPQPNYPRQDADYKKPFNFTKQGDWGVLDNITGLTWEVKTPQNMNDTFTWYQTINGVGVGVPNGGNTGLDTEKYVAQVNSTKLGGYSDWRMPTIKELESIVDYSRINPALGPEYFPNTLTGLYWSSTVDSSYGLGQYVWEVDFGNGTMVRGQPQALQKLRLIRGNPLPHNQFTITDNGLTVTDASTGLMWKRTYEMRDPANPGDWLNRIDTFQWQEALQRAVADTTGGHTDWRLPNIKELHSIIDETLHDPAIDIGTGTHGYPSPESSWISDPNAIWFPRIQFQSVFWSSSPVLDFFGNQDMSWVVAFDAGGEVAITPRYFANYVRLVRDVTTAPVSPATSTALITINGQPSVTNADPLVSRTWAWSGTPGATYSASGNITGCENTSQNGPQPDWKPWIGGTGTAISGSTSATPGAVKYGCVITGTYKVTNAAGETTTASATITYRHANGSANTAVVDTGSNNSGGLTITTGGTLHPIQSDHYWNFNLAYTGGSGTPTWSIVSGSLPATLELDQVKGTINNNNFFNHSPISVNNHIPEGTYTFTVKVTVGSQSTTKQLSLEVRPLSDMRPIIMFGQKLNNAVNEFIQGAGDAGMVGTYHFYYFPSTENDVCTIVSGQLPPGIVFKSSVNGCMISGVPTVTGTFSITWKIENQYGSDTADYPITVFTPRASITTTASSLPNATIGEPYNYQFPIIQEGNLTAMETSNITFGVRGGMPPGLSIDGSTGLISGTPTVAGLYNPVIYFGVGTEMYLSHVVIPPLLVKPRTQSLSGLNADIVSAMNSLSWTTSNSAQSATSFKATMKQEGWTIGDVATATGYKEIDLVNTLYPVAAGGDLRAPDAVAKYDMIRFLIQGYVQTFDWSDANKQQSAISFKALMNQKGWTLDWVKTAFPFTLGGQDPILTEILKAYNSGTANSSPVISSLSPSSGKAGTTVTINGSGFTGTNNISINGILIDPATVSSSGGLTPTWISFVVPSNLSSCFDRLCPLGPALQTGTHSVFVQNTNGTSNTVSFVVN